MAMPKPMFRNKEAWLKYRRKLKEREIERRNNYGNAETCLLEKRRFH